ncbi:MAG: MATE family efflux transporter [Bacteroidota bacterium]
MNKQILRLALPNILSNLSVPLLGMVDTALMGRMDAEEYLGAIALGGIIFSFVYWGFGFLRMGTTGLTANSLGTGDKQQVQYTLWRGLGVAAAGSVLVIGLQFPIEWISFWLIEGEPQVESLAADYFYIRIWAAPATIGLYVFHGWFLGMQNARFPMWLTIVVNVLNIVFNLMFVLGLGMKVEGVAWGTLIAQYGGLIMAIGLMKARYAHYLQTPRWAELWQGEALKRFFSVNLDIFIRTLCLIFTFAYFTAKASELGTLLLAANHVLLQYLMLMAYGVDGFAFAAESLVGKYKGQADREALREVISRLFKWGIGIGIAFSLLYALAGTPLLGLFTDQEEVISTASLYINWMILIPITAAVAFMWDGVYIGATATRPMRNTMVLATFGGFLPACEMGLMYVGNHGLWLAMAIFMVVRSISLSVLAKRWIFPLEKIKT